MDAVADLEKLVTEQEEAGILVADSHYLDDEFEDDEDDDDDDDDPHSPVHPRGESESPRRRRRRSSAGPRHVAGGHSGL